MTSVADAAVETERLKDVYRDDPAAKTVFDYLATRQQNRSVTTIDRLLSSLARHGQEVPRADLIRLLRQLEELGCGSFITGRKGHPSRFQWSVGLTEVSRAAAGKRVKVEPLKENHEDESEDSLLSHTFLLRPGLAVTINLPSDFTSAEAFRLSEFIKALPFGSGG